MHRGVEDVARERGVLTFAGSSDERPERERELAESFSARRVDGLIIAPAATDHSYLQRDRAAGVALVFVDRPASFVDADVVLTDNAGGARAAVSHLIEHGHRRIAFLGDRPELHTATERLRGYRDALARHGIAEEIEFIRGAQHAPYAVTRELLLAEDPPTALFTSQNLITIDAVRAIHDLGLQRQVAHVGFDDVALADVDRARVDSRRPGRRGARPQRGRAALLAPGRLHRSVAARGAPHVAHRARVGRARAGGRS